MFEIVRYTPSKAAEWDKFVAQSKNGTFLFNRAYMDYHHDRFEDFSLMVYRKNRLYALFPANIDKDGIWWSHQGLTYGGMIMDEHCKTAEIRTVFVLLNEYLSNHTIRQVVYKHIPWIYSSQPSEEDLFALTNVCHATIRSRDVASAVFLRHSLPLSTLRIRGVKKALKNRLTIEESSDYVAFWQLLEGTLQIRHHASPVHSLSEIQGLQSDFPENIRLFVVKKGQDMIAGTVLYVNKKTVKTQYIAANEEGRMLGALDLLFQQLLKMFGISGMDYFDFGTSNLLGNGDLNDTLIFQKEGFGGRGICYDTYEWTL
ncbi:MAG: GNAT family N-acetyltransferase [Prevotella sp.]|nr:GNAT family N-acetyltransferase [Prevotella sp.]